MLVVVDGGGTGTIAAVVRLEGVDLPGIESGQDTGPGRAAAR